MAVSTHKQTATGSGSADDGINSGVIANGGNIPSTTESPSIFTAKSPMNLVQGMDIYGSRIVVKTGTSAIPGVMQANTSGRIAFNPNTMISRSSTNTGFVMRGGVANLIAGVTGLNPLAVNGYQGAKNSSGVHKKIKTYQKGTWATKIFDIYGGGLLQSDGSAKEGITGWSTASTFTNAIHATDPATDSAASPTRAIPGEFFILSTFTGFMISTAANNDSSGGGTGSGPYMDYTGVAGA
jgi:hypothetical protein